ncbi:MAG: hypothetical protein JHC71_00170 [Blastococcus sp.]|nr:hypothetical protein [Blastococcus sp.]
MTTLLARLSAAQLAGGLAGQALAVMRRAPYDIPFGTGRPEDVVRDSFTNGTAFSAPVHMLVLQGWATRRLARRPGDVLARRVLRVLGAVMVAGYLMERRDRQRLTPGGADAVETPLVVTSLGLAAAMALAGRR